MSEISASAHEGASAEASLLRDLARGDAMLRLAPQMLRHLLATDRVALFSEEVVASLRGMLGDVARQLLPEGSASGATDRLIVSLAENDILLGHIHALALEAGGNEGLRDSLALDPVLSPLAQALITSGDAAVADTAMRWLAAQARFCDYQRHMRLPLAELPPEVLRAALLVARAQRAVEAEAEGGGADTTAPHAEALELAARATHDESATRLGLAARLVAGMAAEGGAGLATALILPHAGLGLFATALAQACGQSRDLVMQSLQPGLGARAALCLCAAGLPHAEVVQTLWVLDPATTLPESFALLTPAQAAVVLARGEEG